MSVAFSAQSQNLHVVIDLHSNLTTRHNDIDKFDLQLGKVSVICEGHDDPMSQPNFVNNPFTYSQMRFIVIFLCTPKTVQESKDTPPSSHPSYQSSSLPTKPT